MAKEINIKEVYTYLKQGISGARTERIRYFVIRIDWQILLEFLLYRGPNFISALPTLIEYWYRDAVKGPYLPPRIERSGIGDFIRTNNSIIPRVRYNIC